MLSYPTRPTARIALALLLLLLAGPFLFNRWSARRVYSALTSAGVDHETASRAGIVQRRCLNEADDFEREYGRANLRMARAYDGSGTRLKRVIEKALRGEPINISVLGGSVTGGHGVNKDEIWANIYVEWFKKLIPEHGEILGVNGAVPATGSDYFSFCFSSHIPLDSDLILIELAINDEPLDEHTENMENLLRSLLHLPHNPAIVMVEALGLGGGSMRYGGDIHTPVAIYYDIPVISMRNPLAPHLMRHPDLVRPYFTNNYWNDPDVRHVNARGHRDMARMVESLVFDMTCEVVDAVTSRGTIPPGREEAIAGQIAPVQAALPEQVKQWGPWKHVKEEGEPHMMLGCWPPEDEMGQIPRLRFNQRWDDNVHNLPLEPQCFSTRSEQSHLIPTRSSGWAEWSHPDRPDKVYLYSNTTGSVFSMDIETRLGIIKMYSLRSKTFGLGSVWCWVGDDYDGGVRADGYWENGDANIGRFTTIATGLPPRTHTVSCELLEETADPDGGHEFRIISVMSM